MARPGRPPRAPSTPSSVSSSGVLDSLNRPSPSQSLADAAMRQGVASEASSQVLLFFKMPYFALTLQHVPLNAKELFGCTACFTLVDETAARKAVWLV